METVQKKNEEMEQTHEEFNLGATIIVILLFLTFIGSSFYLMLESY